jgi:hypothetical protein
MENKLCQTEREKDLLREKANSPNTGTVRCAVSCEGQGRVERA